VPELAKYCDSIRIIQVDDFVSLNDRQFHENVIGKSSTSLRPSLRAFLLSTGLLNESNSDKSFESIRWYVKSIRGHYSLRRIEPSTMRQMDELIHSTDDPFINPSNIRSSDIGIHYRLGDLIHLENKGFIAPERLKKVFREVDGSEPHQIITLSSDSRETAIDIISDISPVEREIKLISGDALQTISRLQIVETFIGTNSKLSLWILLLRLYFSEQKRSWMPNELKHHIEANIIQKKLLNEIAYY
jgi:hypothetical protein